MFNVKTLSLLQVKPLFILFNYILLNILGSMYSPYAEAFLDRWRLSEWHNSVSSEVQVQQCQKWRSVGQPY